MAEGGFFAVQQFTTINRKPWFALQRRSGAGVVQQWTGYRHEMEELIRRLGVTPEELAPTTEDELFTRLTQYDGYEE